MPAAAQASRAAGGSEVDDFAAETMEAMEIEILDERVTRDGEQSFVLGISSVRRHARYAACAAGCFYRHRPHRWRMGHGMA